MTLTAWILLACVASFAIKLSGYLVPKRVMEGPRIGRVSGALTVALLASLTVTNAVGHGQALLVDSRLLGLTAAVIELRFKAPFLLVVVIGAVATALGRLAGLP